MSTIHRLINVSSFEQARNFLAESLRRAARRLPLALGVAALVAASSARTLAQTVVNFTTAGPQTWTCPAGVTSVQVEAYGGGGGSGGAGAHFASTGGGAGGSYVRVTSVTVTPGTVYQLTVGAGGTAGAGGAVTGTAGGTGGSSYFGNTTSGNPAGAVILAVGGPGSVGNNSAGSTTTNRTVTAGATATNSGNVPSGAAADTAGSNGATPSGTANDSGAGGAGAGPLGNAGGGAGGAALTSAGNGNPGTAPGGGGGGADQSSGSGNGTGGAGGTGKVVLTFTASAPTINVAGTISQFSTGIGTASAPASFSASGANLTANVTVTAPSGFEISTSSGTGYSGSLTLTPSGGTVASTTIYVRLAAADSAGAYSGNVSLSSTGASTVTEAVPVCTVDTPFTAGNLAVEQLATNATSSTFAIIELSPSAANQSAPVNTYYVPSTGASALRQSSAGSTGRLATSNDGTLLAFSAFEDPNGVTDETSITQRGAGSLSQSYQFTLQASYTDSAGTGDQTRGATFNGGTWYMSDKNGIWLNGATTAANTTNIRPVKSFGGTVYAMSANATLVSTVSADGTTLTGLTGLGTDANAVDFYMLSSGVNGSAFDILYVLDGTTVTKYSLVAGTWTVNGSATAIGITGDGFCAVGNGTGAYLYASTGTGLTVSQVTDASGYNQAPSINTADDVTLYTASAGYLKGVGFAPLAAALPDLTIAVSAPATASSGVNFNYTVTVANSGAAAATGVNAQFTLPSGLSFVSANDNGGGGFSSAYNSGVVSFTGGSLAAGASDTLTVTVSGGNGTYVVDGGPTPASGHGAAVINTPATTATPIAESNSANNSCNVSATTVVAPASPQVAIGISGSSTAVANSPGNPITYTLTAQNPGGEAATGVSVQYTLPSGVTYVSAADTGSAGFTASYSGGVVTFSGGTLAAGATETLTVTVEATTSNYRIYSVDVPAGAAVISASNVTGSSSSTGTVTTSVTLPSGPDLVVTSTPNGPFLAGDSADTLTLYVSNDGTAASSGAVTVTDLLPTGLTPTSAMNGATQNGWSISVSGQTVTATRSDVLNCGATYPAVAAGLNYYPALTLTFSVASGASGAVTNSAAVTGGADAFTANDSATNTITLGTPTPISSAGYLLVSRGHYTGASITPGTTVLPNGAVASVSGTYPEVWQNEAVDESFGVAAPIYLDVVNPTSGAVVNSTNLTSLIQSQLGINVCTSFSSKSEVGLTLTPDGTGVTLSGYIAPAGQLDVSNANTLYHDDPTCLIAANGDFQKAIVQVDDLGNVQVTPNNSYSGDNCRAVVLGNATDGNSYYYTAGSAGNSGSGVTGTTMTMLAQSTGIQMVLPGAGGQMTAVGEAFGTANSSTGYQLGYDGQPSDKTGKDMNLRALTLNPYNNTLYTSKGSGGSGVDTVYQIGAGALPTSASASSQVFTIASGFPTASGTIYPFGIWFANAYTMYVGDEGAASIPTPSDYSNGQYTQALPANNPSAGLQKWINSQPDGSGTWTLAYTLNSGLNLGVPYSYTIANYATGVNPATGVPWQPANNGLRNIAGKINGDGTVTVYAITSTISGETDEGADPNQLVVITDNLGATSLPGSESFSVLVEATGLDCLRGVALSTPYTPNLNASFSASGNVPVTANGYSASGITLDPITLGFAPTAGQVLTLVNNTGSTAIVGTFTSLPQGSTVTGTYNGTTYNFTISYVGGTGNDITLTAQAQGGGGPGPATDSPAMPPWGLAMLAALVLAIGAMFAGKAKRVA